MTKKDEEIKLKEIKTFYDKEETKIREHYFVNEKGELHGVFEEYHDNGKLWLEWNFEKGKLHGVFKGYGKNGELLFEWNYENGELISDKIY